VLTDEGLLRLEQMAPLHVDAVRRLLFDPLGADAAMFGMALERVLDALAVTQTPTADPEARLGLTAG